MIDINIQDESGDKNYFTIVPNYVLNHSTSTAQAMYLQLKRLAGEKGETFCSRKYLMDKLGVTKPTVIKEINYLIEKGWIKENGEKEIETKGGTQSVKSYKIVDLWQLNRDYYKGGKKETQPRDKGGKKYYSKGVNKGGKKEAHKEEPLEEEPVLRRTNNTAETSSALISEVIKLFEKVNPACKNYYGNKTQRMACQNLIEEYGFDEVSKVIAFLPRSNQMTFVPTIITPHQLWEKYQALKDGLQKKRGELTTKVRGLEI